MKFIISKKKSLIVSFLLVFACAASYKILTHEVTYTKGINYEVKEYKIPLYLKICSFLDRHFHYKYLAQTITYGLNSESAKILAIFNWVQSNIKPQPDALPTVDDHPLNIIIRGYGAGDQFEDVFTLLCNYSGVAAYMAVLESSASNDKITLSFVFYKEKWRVFHVAKNLMFYVNNEWASFEELLNARNNEIRNIEQPINVGGKITYLEYFRGFKGFYREYKDRYLLQTPFGRVETKVQKFKMP